MNIVVWVLLILNGLVFFIDTKNIFTEETVKSRVLNAIDATIKGMTVYLMLYILGIII